MITTGQATAPRVAGKTEGRKIRIRTNWRSPTLQTVLMVERFIEEHNSKYKKTELFKKLPKKMMWGTFQTIIEYLEGINKIIIEKDGVVTYIWNPGLYEKIKNRKEIKI